MKIIKKLLAVLLVISVLATGGIVVTAKENSYTIRYHADGWVYTSSGYSDNGAYQIDSNYSTGEWFRGRIIDSEAIVGWEVTETGESIYYNCVDGTYITAAPGTYNLYPITVPVAIDPSDVYSFTNNENNFDIDGTDKYFMTPEDAERLVSGTYEIGRGNILALPAAVTAAILSLYPDFPWNGACIGFAVTVCLQKKGLLDVVSTQKGAECINDLKPDEELVSLLNYYNAQAAANILTKNKGLFVEGPEYSRQLEKLYNSAANGNLVLLEFYTIPTLYHGVVVSGAYTDSSGNHYLLCYDENSRSYSDGKAEIVIISPDFSSIDVGYGSIDGFLWTDTFEGYKSFDINSDYDSSYFHIKLIEHIFTTLKEWFSTYVIGMLGSLAALT